MKVDYIESVLQVLKDEGETELNEIKYEIKSIENILPRYTEEIKMIQEEIAGFKVLLESKSNIFKTLHLYLPIIEIPLIAVILTNIFVGMTFGITEILLVLLSVIGACDIAYMLESKYRNIDSNNNTLNRIINVLKKSLLSKESLNTRINELECSKNDRFEQERALNAKLGAYVTKSHELREEISYIDGNLQALTVIKNRHKVNDLADSMELVRYVSEKKELKLRA